MVSGDLVQGDAALDRTGIVLRWQVQLAIVRTHFGLWCKRMMMQHQGMYIYAHLRPSTLLFEPPYFYVQKCTLG